MSDVTREELLKHLEMMATPMDFDSLIGQGLLIKEGAWYLAPNINNLPEHVSKKVKETRFGNNGTKIKFYGHEKYKKMLDEHS